MALDPISASGAMAVPSHGTEFRMSLPRSPSQEPPVVSQAMSAKSIEAGEAKLLVRSASADSASPLLKGPYTSKIESYHVSPKLVNATAIRGYRSSPAAPTSTPLTTYQQYVYDPKFNSLNTLAGQSIHLSDGKTWSQLQPQLAPLSGLAFDLPTPSDSSTKLAPLRTAVPSAPAIAMMSSHSEAASLPKPLGTDVSIPRQTDKRLRMGKSIGSMLKGFVGLGASNAPSPLSSTKNSLNSWKSIDSDVFGRGADIAPPSKGLPSPIDGLPATKRALMPSDDVTASVHTSTSSESFLSIAEAFPSTAEQVQAMANAMLWYDADAEAARIAQQDAVAEALERSQAEALVRRLQKVVLDAFRLTADDLVAAISAEARRARKLESLLLETKKRLTVAENRYKHNLPPQSVAELQSAVEALQASASRVSTEHSTNSWGNTSGMYSSSKIKLPAISGSASAMELTEHIQKLQPRSSLPIDSRTTFAEYVLLLDDPILAKIDDETVASMNAGIRIKVHEDQFRLMMRSVAHMPAFLSLVLFQRIVERTALTDMSVALMMTEIRELRSRLVAVTAGIATPSNTFAWSEYVAKDHTGVKIKAATNIAASNGYDEDAGYTQLRSPYTHRIVSPANLHEALLRRSFDRIRENQRFKMLDVSICALDFMRVWHPCLDEEKRQLQFLPLLVPSPDPLVLHIWMQYRNTLKKRVHRHQKAGDSGPVAPSLEKIQARRAASADLTAESQSTYKKLNASVSVSKRTSVDGRSPMSSMILQSAEYDPADEKLGGSAEFNKRIGTLALARVSLLDFGYAMWESGITFPQRIPTLIHGHGLPRTHRVFMEDLAPSIECLVDRHPDFVRYREKPVLRRRYIQCVLTSIFASLVGGHALQGVPVHEIVNSNLVDSLYVCSTGHTVSIVPFSNKYFEELNADFDAGVELTKHFEPKRKMTKSASADALKPATDSKHRDDFDLRASQLSTVLTRCSPAKATLGLEGTTLLACKDVYGLPDPQPDLDDAAYLTMPALTSQCDVQVTNAILERIFAGRARSLLSGVKGKFSFEDFVWFNCYQQDRMRLPSLDYWARCLDLDDDGVLSQLDLECAYEAKAWQIQDAPDKDMLKGLSTAKNIMTAVLDLIEPMDATAVTRLDIKRSACGPLIFDLLIALKGSAASRNYV